MGLRMRPSQVFAIGGGFVPKAVTKRLLEATDIMEPRIMVCGFASMDRSAGNKAARSLFVDRHGCDRVVVMDDQMEFGSNWQDRTSEHRLSLRHQLDSKSCLEQLEVSTIFFFCGGDQRILLDIFEGTLFLKQLRHQWARGQTIVAGTSAGLQVLSELAFTGDLLPGRDSHADLTSDEIPVKAVVPHFVELRQGFGFMGKTILDQHFIVRQRHNRLFSAVLEHPSFFGIGVDEETAIHVKGFAGEWVQPQVIGNSCAFYVSAKEADIARKGASEFSRAHGLTCGFAWSGENVKVQVEVSRG